METIKIAESFVILIKKYNWDKTKEIPTNEEQILFEIVSAAGFEIGSTKQGEAIFYDDEDKRIYAINKFCPYKIVDLKREVHDCATKWLDCVFAFAGQENIGTKEKIEVIRKEIERSRVSLEVICLTADGDTLEECRDLDRFSSKSYCVEKPPYGYLKNHLEDADKLRGCVGIHKYCKGLIVDKGKITLTNRLMICRGCYLRITFPMNIETYGELRRFLLAKPGVDQAIY